MMKSKKIFICIFLVVIGLVFAKVIYAAGASLYLTPVSENRRVGEVFDLTLKVDSIDQSINAIQGSIAYTSDKLEIINISKAGSILKIWVVDPTYSNRDGLLSFSGGLASPGFRGPNGTILHIIFKARSPGAASIIWQQGAVLANDGAGTNILSSLENADLVIESRGGGVEGSQKSLSNLAIIIISVGATAVIFLIMFLIYSMLHRRKHLIQESAHHVRDVVEHDFKTLRKEAKNAKLSEDLEALEKKIEKEIENIEKKVE